MRQTALPRPTAAIPALALAAPLALGAFATAACAQEIPSDEIQLAQALLASPAEMRAGATVLAWRPGGNTEVIRQGDNGLICLADRPGDDRFDVACYHESLEPYMERGRELSRQGVEDRNAVRWAEAESGELAMPAEPAGLYITAGDISTWDPETMTAPGASTRYVLYVPGATVASTGIQTRPTPDGGPWLMFPGTPGAHIMITPPQGGGN